MLRSQKPQGESDTARPVLAVTRHDRVTSLLMALMIVGGAVVAWQVARATVLRGGEAPTTVEVELIEIAGGDPEGLPGETLSVDSPDEQPAEDPSQADQLDEEATLKEELANVLDSLSELDMDLVDPQDYEDQSNRGQRGRAEGDSTLRNRGAGGGPGSGLPREQRWVIYYDPGQTLQEYAKQLDFFGIELGAVVGGRLIYVSHLADEQPRRRTGLPGEDYRIRWLWRGGSRRQADVALLKKAGINAEKGIVMQFLPRDVEEELARLERRHAGRAPQEIQRTAFRVQKAGDRYEFYVIEQEYF